MRAVVTIYWPAMPTHHTSPGMAMTDQIDGDCTIECEDGRIIHFKVHIECTLVRMQKWLGFIPNPMHWRVDACAGLGVGMDFRIDLPPEDCYIRVGADGVHMDVVEIPCPVRFTLADGTKGGGIMRGTACKSYPKGKGEWLVDPVTFGPMECDMVIA